MPSEPVRVADLLPVLHSCDDAVIAAAVDANGRPVSCRAGCGACCRQLVPIAEVEAIALGEWVAELPEAEQAAVRERFAQAIAAIASRGMLGRLREADAIQDVEQRRRLGLEYFHIGVPCPFLVNESCGIYERRPMKCREYLVTSPAEHCATPEPEGINMAHLPVSLFNVLANFRKSSGEAVRWVPLVLALEWYEGNKDRGEEKAPGVELLREFLMGFTG